MRILQDLYARTVADGWSKPTIGETYVVDEGAAADFDVTGTQGTINVATAGARNRIGSPITTGSLDLTISVATDKQAEDADQVFYLFGKRVDANNCYAVRLTFDVIGTVRLGISKIIANVETTILPDTDIPDLVHTAGIFYNLRCQFVDSYPCTINARVWYTGGVEPSDWQVSATDATASLQVVGGMGTGASLETGTTNFPVLFTVDDLLGDDMSSGFVVTNNPGAYNFQDTFTRTAVVDGWGVPDLGVTWAVDEPDGAYANFDTTGTTGTIGVPAAGSASKQRASSGGGLTVPDGVALVKFKTDKLAVGGAQEFWVGMRQTTGAGTSRYAARLGFTVSQTVELRLYKVLAGVATALTDNLVVPGTHAAGQDFWVRFSVIGSGASTFLEARAWQDGTTEPTTWQVSAVDGDATLAGTSRVSLQAELGSGASNAPVLYTVDDYSVTPAADPYTIVSQSGINEADLDMRVRMLNSDSQVGWVVVGRRYAESRFAAPWLLTPTAGTDTTTVTNTTSTTYVGGTYNQTTLGGTETWARRDYGSISATPTGVYRVFGRFAKTVEVDDWVVRLHWSLATNQVSHVNDEVSLLSLRGSAITWVDLGLVELPVSTTLNLEIWMAVFDTTTGPPTGNVLFDYVKLVPVEKWSELRIPAEEFQRWGGDEGVAVGGTVLADGVATMAVASDAVRYPHSTGIALESDVLHVFEFDVGIQTPDTIDGIAARVVKAGVGPQLTRYKSTLGRETLRLVFRQTTGGLYYLEVEVNAALVASTVHNVRHNIIRYAKKGQEFRVDTAAKTAAIHDTNGAYLRPVLLTGDWPTVVPGDNEFVVALGSVDTGSENLSVRDASALLDLRAAPTF